MSQQLPALDKIQRRSLAVFVVFSLSFGLVFVLITYAGRTPSVKAEGVMTPQLAQLEVGKEGPDSTYAGRVITYTVKITNNLGAPINNVIVTDTWAASEDGDPVLPAVFNGNYWADPPDFVSEFTYTLPSPTNKSGSATWILDPLPAEFRGTIEFTMTVPAELQPLYARWSSDVVGPSVLGNSVGIQGDGVTVNEPDQVVTAILGPVFKLEKLVETEPGVGPRPGRLITYALRLNNLQRLDSVPATNIVLWEILPPELIFEEAGSDASATIDFDSSSRRITWTLASDFVLSPGEVTTATFVTRLSPTQEWRTEIINEPSMCAVSASELINPVDCYKRNKFKTLGIVDKTYVTEPRRPSGDSSSYPNRYITYTIYVFNPLSQSVASNLRITDIMPSTWDFVRMIDGDDPVAPSGDITNTVVWRWSGDALQPNGVISFTWLALIGPQTSVQSYGCNGVFYRNALAASADQFPIVYQYGRPFVDENGMASVTVEQQVEFGKGVSPTAQVAGEVVTYTASLRNTGDRTVNGIIFTDTLPYYFRYAGMVSDLEPINVPTRTIVWYIDSLEAGEKLELAFMATVEGEWQEKYPNELDAYSDETSFCPESKAKVTVLSPLVYDKEAIPALDSGEWVVQGEWFEYTVEFWNQSSVFDHTIAEFADQLRPGFVVSDSGVYATSIDPPFTLLTGMANSWTDTFRVDTPGLGSGTEWCDELKIAEGNPNKEVNRELFQDKETFGVFVPALGDSGVWALNGSKDGYMLFKPHVDLRQTLYPNRVGISETVEVTLALFNNMRDYHDATTQPVDNIAVTFTLPTDFSFVEMISPSPLPISQSAEELVWSGINLPAGEGAVAPVLNFLLRAPSKTAFATGRAEAMPADPAFCIPMSTARYEVVKGVEIVKKPDQDAVGPFGIVEYELVLSNLTTAQVTGLVVTDTLPSGFEFLGVLPGDLQPTSLDPLVWRDLSLNPDGESGDAIRIHYKVQASGLFGLYYNMVDGVSDSTNVARSDKYLENVEVAVLPGVALYKVVSTDGAEAGQTVVYTLTVDNRSYSRIAGLRVTDTLPSNFSYQGIVTGPIPITTTPELVWMVDQLKNGEKIEFVFRATLDGQIPSDVYCNQASATAYVSGDPTSKVTIPDTDFTACVDVVGIPTVTRDKWVWPREVRAGELVTYTITLYNQTEEPQSLRLTDTLPMSFTFDSAVGTTPEPSQTSPVVWDSVQVGSQQTATLVFRAQVDLYARNGTYYNRLDAAIGPLQLSPKPRLAPVQVEEIPRYDLQITKSDGSATADEGDSILYTIVYTNVNEANLRLTDVVITDTFSPLPPYAEPLNVVGWEQIAENGYTYSVGDLDAGESGSIEFTLKLSDSIPASVWVISNSVEIGHDTAGQIIEVDPSNNRSTDLNILRGSDLVVTQLEVTPAEPQAGDLIQFSATVLNQGKDDTLNEAGESWFVVELYLKDSELVPAGPPVDVFDHAGGFWTDASGTQERMSYLCEHPGLSAQEEDTCTFVITDVEEVDNYAVYVQVDVSFLIPEEPWGHDYGAVAEAVESNNIFAYGTMHVGGRRTYLPIVTRNH